MVAASALARVSIKPQGHLQVNDGATPRREDSFRRDRGRAGPGDRREYRLGHAVNGDRQRSHSPRGARTSSKSPSGERLDFPNLAELMSAIAKFLPYEVDVCVSLLQALSSLEPIKSVPLDSQASKACVHALTSLTTRTQINGLPPSNGHKFCNLEQVVDFYKAKDSLTSDEIQALRTYADPKAHDLAPPPPGQPPPLGSRPTTRRPRQSDRGRAPSHSPRDGNKSVTFQAGDGCDSKLTLATLESLSTEHSLPGLARPSKPWLPPASIGGIRQRLFALFDDTGCSRCSQGVATLMMLAICISTVSFVMESMPRWRYVPADCAVERSVLNCEPRADPSFWVIEAVCIAIFTVDYVVRISTFHSVPSNVSSRLLRTLLYAMQALNVIDLLAIIPFYVGLFAGDVGPMRVLRLARILRLFKAARHHPGIMMLVEVMMMSGLPLLILLFFNVIITILFAALIYFAEGLTFSVDPQFTEPQGNGTAAFPTGVYVRPDQTLREVEVSPFRSIAYGVWWVVTTMTTVGYGDMSPTSVIGKTIGIACFYVGIVFLALPISVIVTNFEIVYKRMCDKKELMGSRSPSSSGPSAIEKSVERLRRTQSTASSGWLPMAPGFRKKLFIFLEDPGASLCGKLYSIVVICIILISTSAFVMETMPDFRETPEACRPGNLSILNCEPMPAKIFYKIEIVCIAVFTLDYVLRMATVHTARPGECGLLDDAAPLGSAELDDEVSSPDVSPTNGEAEKNGEEQGEQASARRMSQASLMLGQNMPPMKTTFLYAIQVLNIIDLVAIVPFYIELTGAGGGGAGVMRVLRLVRVFRVLKVPKLRACADMFTTVVADALPALFLLLFLTALLCVFFAALIVFAEGSNFSLDHFTDEYPNGVYIRPTKDGHGVEVSPFTSILYAFWWFFTTATTVGYGDDYPTTTTGRIVGTTLFYTGIVLIALPITIVGGCFNKYYPDWVKEFGSAPKETEAEDDDSMDSPLSSECSGASLATPMTADAIHYVKAELLLPAASVDANGEPTRTVGLEEDEVQALSPTSPMSPWNSPSRTTSTSQSPRPRPVREPQGRHASRHTAGSDVSDVVTLEEPDYPGQVPGSR
eukprot:TRINITY_DN25151_c0_g2_i1.p1 TRINITY_DN25151_c0_g2~~TRINITY_DN25151_c0_g2_i1.p1  ORF type:complete len:1096 (+),score=187.23 TRINITY_DN25151_c0_g2_i1:95-3382(+)